MKTLVKAFILLFLSIQSSRVFSTNLLYNNRIELNSKKVSLSDSLKLAYLEKYQINVKSIDCSDLYIQIYNWIGVKYAYGKATKKGTDCSHFVSNIMKEWLGIEIKGSAATIYSDCIKVQKEDLVEGDLVFFKINKKKISHVGVYLQNGKFAHAAVDQGVTISDLDEKYYKKYFVGGGKIKSKYKSKSK